MRRATLLLACLALVFGYANAGAAETKPPYELVRSLQALQDQMVLGNRAARAEVPQLTADLATRLLAYNSSVWHEPRNVRAVVTYLLSGGDPRVAQAVLATGNCPPQEKRLIEAALAYTEGHAGRAKALLTNLDPRTLDPMVGAHIALVQAALVAEKYPEKAIAFLDVARVLAPGTLVEEAALRREIFLINATGDFERFMKLSGEYIRRFHNSAYADNFREHFSDAIARLDISGDSEQLQQIDDALSALLPGDQLKIYLMIARASVIRGKIPAAEFAALKAEDLAAPNSTEIGRAQLYDGAAEIFTPSYQRGQTLLGDLDGDHLTREESSLKDAALSVSQQIHAWPQIDQKTKSGEAPQDAVQPALDPVMASTSQTIAAAQKALADMDDLKTDAP
jgi:chemotaxis protein MotC